MAKNLFSGLFGKKNAEAESEPPSQSVSGEPPATANAVEQQNIPDNMPTEGDGLPAGPSDIDIQSRDATAMPEPAAQAAEQPPAIEQESKKNWWSRLTDGLAKSSTRLTDGVAAIFTKRKLDAAAIDDLTDVLIAADLGVPLATRVTDALAQSKFDKEVSDEEVRAALSAEIASTLSPLDRRLAIDAARKPHVILMIGVNGAGKTTTIGKLAQKFRNDDLSVLLAAGDTFRAAAIEQLAVWGERTGAQVISRDVGADSAGLAFDALKTARETGTDVLLIDTAGRLQNKSELMDELAKVVRVLKKQDETAPHDVLLVLDATVGQNALNQAQVFKETAGVTGIVMTKLDGTARGGVLVALADKYAIPIHYIGVGESVEDLQDFNADQFARALTGLSEHVANRQ
ncbi:MAG: signal recognition particle-docking protein FtsY [Pseudomonadota bacterium]